MPPQLGPCVGCGSTASKYKCPTCYAATCSLNCSKGHRAQHDGIGSEGQSSKSSGTPTPSSSIPTASTTQRTKTNQYVPLKEYTENQFLHDYHFLSSIGRKVSSAGSHLLSQGLLPQQVEANLNALNRTRGPPPSGSSQPGPTYRPDFEKVRHLKMRSSLKEELRKRKCKIMWLPEGMGREKGNRTRWDERSKRVKFSLDVKCGATSHQYHDLPSNLPVQIKVLETLERESFKAAPAEWQQEQRSGGSGTIAGAKGGKRARKRQRQDNEQEDTEGSKEEGSKAQHKSFYISDFILASRCLLDSSVKSPSKIPQPHAHLPSNVTVAVQVHNMRLRNESSLKYLEWWERRGKREEEQEGEVDEVVSTETPARAWGEEQPALQITAPLNQAQAPTNPFIPSALLSSLSAQLDAFKAVSNGVRPAAPTSDTAAQLSEPEEEQPMPTATNRRNLYLLPTTQTPSSSSSSPPHVSFIGIEALLRSLPLNWAVVEYPTVEVWRKDELQRCKDVEIVRHAETDSNGVEAERCSSPTAIPASTAVVTTPTDVAPVPSPPRLTVTAKPAPAKPAPAKPIASAGLGLGAYDSDESDGEGDNEPTPPPAGPLKRVKTLAEQELLALRSASSSSAASEDEKYTAVGGGLADLARTLGLVPPPPPAQESAAADAVVIGPEDEQEVDWE